MRNEQLTQLSETIQENIITCVDGNLEYLVTNKHRLNPRDLEKLKTDLCAMVCDEIAKLKN